MVARSARGQVSQAVAVELDEFPHHALLAQHLRDGQHQVGGGDALAQLAGELEADDLGDQHRYRLAEHGGFRLDAADAPADTPRPLIMVVWESVPTRVSGKA